MTYEVLGSTLRYQGKVVSLRTDDVRMPDGSVAQRDVVDHPGAVGAAAIDDDLRVLLIRQYRHAIGGFLWELPAGIRDVDGEDPAETARRELQEETGWSARDLSHLVTAHATPGGSNEVYDVYLARDLTEGTRPECEGEEQDLESRWLPLAEACEWVLDGRITNGMCVVGVLAAARRLGV